MTEHDPQQAVDDLRDLDREIPNRDIEARIWRGPMLDGDGHVRRGEFRYIGVEVVPGSSSEILNDVINEHELVIRSFSCGTKGFRATLDYEGRVHE